MGPLGRGGDVVLELHVGDAGPRHENLAALLVLEHLAGVEVKAEVELDEVVHVHAGIRTVGVLLAWVLAQDVDDLSLHGEVARVVDGLEAVLLLGHTLRTHEQELLVLELRDARALPHVAERTVADVGGRSRHLPLDAVVGGVQQRAAVALDGAAAQQHPPFAVFLPHLGVAHVVGGVRRVLVVAQHGTLLAEGDVALVAVIGANDQGLVGLAPLEVVVVTRRLATWHELVTSVVEPQLVAVHDAGARVRAVLIGLHAGHDGAAVPIPGEQIWAGPVSPAMTGLARPTGLILVEDVIDALEVAQAVGVGDVAGGHLQVIAQTPVVALGELDEHGHGQPSFCCGRNGVHGAQHT